MELLNLVGAAHSGLAAVWLGTVFFWSVLGPSNICVLKRLPSERLHILEVFWTKLQPFQNFFSS